ncbi:TPA: hypothetical protein I8H22_002593 [Salmonella enterica subsp. enterica serovar Anatum]|nr:hypothetical protein [Salmonella enterica subsp. enterica serovar Anatum]
MNSIHKTESKFIEITQSLSDFGFKIGNDGKLIRLDGNRIKNYAAEKEWIGKLKHGDRLPRGKFFRNKKAGKPLVIVDEFHNFHRY